MSPVIFMIVTGTLLVTDPSNEVGRRSVHEELATLRERNEELRQQLQTAMERIRKLQSELARLQSTTGGTEKRAPRSQS